MEYNGNDDGDFVRRFLGKLKDLYAAGRILMGELGNIPLR